MHDDSRQGGKFLYASATLMALGATRVRARVEVGGLTVFPGSHDLDGRFAFEQNGPSATIPDGRCEGNIHDPMQRTGLNNSRKRLWHSSRFVCTRGRLAHSGHQAVAHFCVLMNFGPVP